MKIIKKLNEDIFEPSHSSKVKEKYRKLTGMNKDDKIIEENLEDWAVDKVAVRLSEGTDTVKKWLLEDDEEDDVTIDAHNKQIAAEVNADVELEEDDSQGIIERELDRILKSNLRNQKLGKKVFKNILFEGRGGVGKTGRIEAWAQKNGINLVLKKGSEMDVSDFGVMTPPSDSEYAEKVRTAEFDILDQANSVLFLDEYNRTPANVRATLLTLIQSHVIVDPKKKDGEGKKGVKYFPNFLFTIAAINPYNLNYDTFQLDAAEETRFKTVSVPTEKKVIHNYLKSEFENNIEKYREMGDMEEDIKEEQGRLNLLNTLMASSQFQFDDDEEEDEVMEKGNRKPLTARNFEALLHDCDGTKKDFLDNWNYWCNNFKKKIVEMILKDYKDVDDKANQAIGAGSGAKKGTSAFAGRKTLADLVNGFLDEE